MRGGSMEGKDEGELIGSVEKNETTTIQVRRLEYKGENYIDIREFVSSETYEGPTKKGIRLHEGLLGDLAGILGRAAESSSSEKAAS